MTAIRVRGLIAVDTINREGSINRAAKQLRLSQSALTRTLVGIEQAFETPLFERCSTGVVATSGGAIVLPRINRGLLFLKEMMQALLQLTGSRKPDDNLTLHLINMLAERHLQAVLAISECQDLDNAAEKLGITRPALQRTLRELEATTRAPLFSLRRGLHQTEAGEIVVRGAKLYFTEIRHARSELASVHGDIAGTIVIGTLPLSRTMLVPRTINRLAARYPGLHFVTVEGLYGTLVSSLRHGDIDLIVGTLRSPPPFDDLLEQGLFDDRYSIVGRIDHPFTYRSDLSLADLASAPWVLPDNRTPNRRFFDQLFSHEGVSPPSDIVETSSLTVMRAILMESDRLSILSAHKIFMELRYGMLTLLPFRVVNGDRLIGVTIRRDTLMPASMNLLINEMRATADEIIEEVAAGTAMKFHLALPSNSAIVQV